ncbi:hypothetical protein GCM10010206_61070 [Streptomyces cinerochromogenes]|nr:hypothetical protein GCM10010206_61070 [Streptomyces cinerochromogenes]
MAGAEAACGDARTHLLPPDDDEGLPEQTSCLSQLPRNPVGAADRSDAGTDILAAIGEPGPHRSAAGEFEEVGIEPFRELGNHRQTVRSTRVDLEAHVLDQL